MKRDFSTLQSGFDLLVCGGGIYIESMGSDSIDRRINKR
jgi:hypothetical protein